MKRTLITFMATVVFLLGTVSANAVPITFTFADTVTSDGTPGVSDGDTLILEILADNGGSDLLSETWLETDIISAMLSVGTYVASFNSPYFGNIPSFSTDALGNMISSWYDIDGNNTDNLGAGSPGFYGNGVATSSGSFMTFAGGSCIATTDCDGRWTSAASTVPVPLPATLALVGLGFVGLRWGRRKKT